MAVIKINLGGMAVICRKPLPLCLVHDTEAHRGLEAIFCKGAYINRDLAIISH